VNTEWLKDLKVGDRVLIRSRTGYRTDTVEKITPTGQIKIKSSDYKFKNGEQLGRGKWDYGTYLEQWTEEKQNAIDNEKKRDHLAYMMKSVNFYELSLEHLQKIVEICGIE
jgi:hypothetical protein